MGAAHPVKEEYLGEKKKKKAFAMTRSGFHLELVIVRLLKNKDSRETPLKLSKVFFSPPEMRQQLSRGADPALPFCARVPGVRAESTGAHPAQQVPGEEKGAGSVLAKEKRSAGKCF